LIETIPRDAIKSLAHSVFLTTYSALLLLLILSLSGLVLAMGGLFQPLPVTACSLLLWVLALRLLPPPSGPGDEPAIILVFILALVVYGYNSAHVSEHVLHFRDPGVYNTSGRWIAGNGTLLVDAGKEFPSVDPPVEFEARGMHEVTGGGGTLSMHFFHLFPVTIALGSWLTEALMFRVPLALTSLSVLLVYMLARRMASWVPALLVAVLFATNALQLYFSRDAYSEILVQVFFIGGLWLIGIEDSRRPRLRRFAGGLALGACFTAKLDSLVFLLPLLLLWNARQSVGDSQDPRSWKSALWGAGLSISIGFLDGYLFSFAYIQDQRDELILLLSAAMGGLAVFILIVTTLRKRVFQLLHGAHIRRHIATAISVGILIAGIYGYFLRPLVEESKGRPVASVASLQRRQGLEVDPTRTYAESSLIWIAWYLGPAVVLGGIAGWGLLARRVIAGEAPFASDFLLAFSAQTLLYVARPSINPDQIWAMRRYLHVTVPGLIILFAILVAWLWNRTTPVWVGRFISVMMALAALLAPAFVREIVRPPEREWALMAAVKKVCRVIPRDGAVVFVREGPRFGLTTDVTDLAERFSPAVRAFCEVPVGISPLGANYDWYRTLAGRLAEENRPLFVLSSSANPWYMEGKEPSSRGQIYFDEYRLLEERLQVIPRNLDSRQLHIYYATVDSKEGK
jgi:hypothetical protein